MAIRIVFSEFRDVLTTCLPNAIIAFNNGFHGRTMGAVSATAQPKYHEGLGPMLAGFTYVAFGDLAATRAAIDSEMRSSTRPSP